MKSVAGGLRPLAALVSCAAVLPASVCAVGGGGLLLPSGPSLAPGHHQQFLLSSPGEVPREATASASFDVGADWPTPEEACEAMECPHYEEVGGGDGYEKRFYVGDATNVVAWLRSPELEPAMAAGLGLQQVVAYAAGLNDAKKPVKMGAPLTLVMVHPPPPPPPPPRNGDEGEEVSEDEGEGAPPFGRPGPHGGGPEMYIVAAPVAYSESTPAPGLTDAQFNMKVTTPSEDGKGHCVVVSKWKGDFKGEASREAFMQLAEKLKADGIAPEDVMWHVPFVMAYGGEGDDAVIEYGWPLVGSQCGKDTADGTLFGARLDSPNP